MRLFTKKMDMKGLGCVSDNYFTPATQVVNSMIVCDAHGEVIRQSIARRRRPYRIGILLVGIIAICYLAVSYGLERMMVS